jgi:hypothetical protein
MADHLPEVLVCAGRYRFPPNGSAVSLMAAIVIRVRRDIRFEENISEYEANIYSLQSE